MNSSAAKKAIHNLLPFGIMQQKYAIADTCSEQFPSDINITGLSIPEGIVYYSLSCFVKFLFVQNLIFMEVYFN